MSVFDFEEVGVKLPTLEELDEIDNPKPVCKFREHQSGWEWHIFAGDELSNGDYYCYGLVKGEFDEYGMFLLSEIINLGAMYCLLG